MHIVLIVEHYKCYVSVHLVTLNTLTVNACQKRRQPSVTV